MQCAALLLVVSMNSGCALLRLPLPALSFDINVFESRILPGLPRLFDSEPRLGVFGLEILLPRVCDLAEVDTIARGYLARLQAEELGELANNIDIRQVFIEEVRLTAEEGNFAFLSEAGVRIEGDSGNTTYWTTFLDRPARQELVFRPDQPLDALNLIPGDDECLRVSLIYSGTYPATPITLSLDLTLRVRADWQF